MMRILGVSDSPIQQGTPTGPSEQCLKQQDWNRSSSNWPIIQSRHAKHVSVASKPIDV